MSNLTSHGHILKRHYEPNTCSHTNGMRHYTDQIVDVNCIDCLRNLARRSRWAKGVLESERIKRIMANNRKMFRRAK